MIINMEIVVEKYFKNEYNSEVEEKVRDIIINILHSRYHILKVKYNDYNNLLKADFLSQRLKESIEKILGAYSTRMTEIKGIKNKIIVTENINKLKDEIFHISIDKIYNLYIKESVLIGENVIDGNIYDRLGKLYLKNKKLNKLGLRNAIIGAGGNQINVQYKQSIVEEEKLGICFADSDKKYEGCSLGETAKQLVDTWKKDQGVGEIFILKYRELENYIPMELLELLYKEHKSGVLKLFKDKREILELYKYADLKEGIHLKSLCEEGFLNCWENILKKINLSEIKCSNDVKYESFDEIKNLIAEKPKSEIREINFKFCDGYGTKILHDFCNCLGNEYNDYIKDKIKEKRDLSNMLPELKERLILELEEKRDNLEKIKNNLFQNIELEEIAKKTLEWGCYFQPVIPNKVLEKNL